MGTPEESAFRQQATILFRLFVVALFVTAGGLVCLGWWLFGPWGVAGGAILALVMLAVGLAGGGLIYAMSQDSA